MRYQISRPLFQPPCSQDEATRLKAGTIKHCALTVLKDAGARGMAIDDIMAAIAAAGLRQWDANSKRVVQFVRLSGRMPCACTAAVGLHICDVTPSSSSISAALQPAATVPRVCMHVIAWEHQQPSGIHTAEF